MTPDELAALRAKREQHIAEMQAIRRACISLLYSPDEKTRRAAAPRLRRVDARIRALGGIPGEEEPPCQEDEDEGDELTAGLMKPGKRYLLQ